MHHIFLDIYVDIYVTRDIYVTYMLFFICDIYDCSLWVINVELSISMNDCAKRKGIEIQYTNF